jgi:hypothetical protein
MRSSSVLAYFLAVPLAESSDLVLYDGSHRYNTSRDTSMMTGLYAPALGSAWAVGDGGELLRDSGLGWEQFASRGATPSATHEALYPSVPAFFAGECAAGQASEILRQTSASRWDVMQTGLVDRPINSAMCLYGNCDGTDREPLVGGNWAAGQDSITRDTGSGWVLSTSYRTVLPARAAYALYGEAAPSRGKLPVLAQLPGPISYSTPATFSRCLLHWFWDRSRSRWS